MKESGTLKIKVNKARLSRETDLLKKMDPYVILEINGIRSETQVVVRGGKLAEWNETFFFPCHLNDELHFQAWDKDRLKTHDLIGKGLTKIDERYKNTEQSFWFELTYQGTNAGELALEITFILNDPYIIEKSEKQAINLKEKKKYLKELQGFLGMEVNRSYAPANDKPDSDPALDMMKLENESVRTKLNKLMERKNHLFFLMNKLKEELINSGMEVERAQTFIKDKSSELEAARRFKEPGVVLLTCITASFKKNVDKTGKQDPFCIIRLGTQTVTTPVHKDAGLNASWDGSFKLARDMEETLDFMAMNHNSVQAPNKLGFASIGLRSIIWSKKEEVRKLELIKNMEIIGEICFTIQFV